MMLTKDVETLRRRAAPLDMTAAEFRAAGHGLVDQIADWSPLSFTLCTVSVCPSPASAFLTMTSKPASAIASSNVSLVIGFSFSRLSKKQRTSP